MSNTFLTPNMSLIIPIPLTDPGPDWANNINSSFTIVDAHTHNPGSGVQITPTGININADLSYNTTNNAINLRSVRFTSQITPLSGAADLGCIYESGADLYYNDGNGNQVRITQSGSLAGASGTITGLPSGTASAAYSSISGTFIFQQATSTGANMDIGSLIIRYPGSYPTPSGNAIVLAAPSSLSGTYQLTLPSLPSQTNVVSLTSAGIISSITYDQVGQGMTSVGANSIGTSIVRTASSTAIQGGIGVSSSSGTFSTTSASFVPVTGLSLTVVVGPNPIVVKLIPANPTNASSITCTGAAQLEIINNTEGLTLARYIPTANITYTGFETMDFQATSGFTQNYSVNVKSDGSNLMSVTRMTLVAYELH